METSVSRRRHHRSGRDASARAPEVTRSYRKWSGRDVTALSGAPSRRLVGFPLLASLWVLVLSASRVAALPVTGPREPVDCATLCSRLSAPRGGGDGDAFGGNSFGGNFEKCLIVCCMETDLSTLIRIKDGDTSVLETRIARRSHDALPSLTTRARSDQVRALQTFLDRIKGRAPRDSDATDLSALYARDAESAPPAPPSRPLVVDGSCDRYVSVQYERHVDKMRVLIPQKRRWGSTIGSCINAHCGNRDGAARIECIMANCHRNRRSGSRGRLNYIRYHTGQGVREGGAESEDETQDS